MRDTGHLRDDLRQVGPVGVHQRSRACAVRLVLCALPGRRGVPHLLSTRHWHLSALASADLVIALLIAAGLPASLALWLTGGVVAATHGRRILSPRPSHGRCRDNSAPLARSPCPLTVPDRRRLRIYFDLLP
jgi:hypothetical protein